MAHLRRARTGHEDRALVEGDAIELARLVLCLHAAFALASLPVDELRQRRIERSLQRSIGGQRGDGRRPGADRVFLRNGATAVLVLPFLRHGAERLDGVGGRIARGRLRHGARLLVELLARRRRRQDALQRAGAAVELRGREAFHRERRRSADLGHPHDRQQVRAKPAERDLTRRLPHRLLRAHQLGGDVGGDRLRCPTLDHLVHVVVDPGWRLREENAIAAKPAAPHATDASEPRQHPRRGLARRSEGALERASLADRESERKPKPGSHAAMERASCGAADGKLPQGRERLLRQGPQREQRHVRGGLERLPPRGLRLRPPQQRIERSGKRAARPSRGEPARHQATVQRRMKLGRLEKSIADVLRLRARGGIERGLPRGAGIESVEQDEAVVFALPEGRAVAEREEEEEVAHGGAQDSAHAFVHVHGDAQVGEGGPEMEPQRPGVEPQHVRKGPALRGLAKSRDQVEALFGVSHAGHCSSDLPANRLPIRWPSQVSCALPRSRRR